MQAMIWLAMAVLVSGFTNGAIAAKPTPCPDGQFVLAADAAPLLPGGTTIPDVLTIAGGQASIASGCAASPAKVRARKRATRVTAKWEACGATSRVRLKASMASPACEVLAGSVRGRGLARMAFEATRVPPVAGLNAIYALRDQVMASSARGSHYIALFDQFRTEVVAWLMHADGLLAFGQTAILAWMPHFEALVNGTGDGAVITADQIAGLEEFFARLSEPSSFELQAVIAAELAAVAPLSDFVGLTMTEALAKVVAIPVADTLDAGGGRGNAGCAAICLLTPICNY